MPILCNNQAYGTEKSELVSSGSELRSFVRKRQPAVLPTRQLHFDLIHKQFLELFFSDWLLLEDGKDIRRVGGCEPQL